MSGRTVRVVAVVVVLALSGCTGPATEAADVTADSPTPSEPTPTATANGTLDVHFINTGVGTSTLVVGPTGETMLIDSGDWQDDGEYVIEYLERQGIDRLDYLVSTHADADHIGGHAAVIEHLETEGDGVGAVYDPGVTASTRTYERYLDAIETYDVPLFRTRAGDTIPFAGAEVAVLAPPEPYLASGDRNENSIVLRLQHGAASFLFPGDAGPVGEGYLRSEYGARLDVTVLQAGHHGSNTSSSGPFLDVVTPQVAVISSPYDSQYGHPDDAVLQRLAARSVTTYWTGSHGDVVLTSNGTAITVATQQADPTVPTALREGDAIGPGSTAERQVRTVVDIGEPSPPVATDGGTATEPPATDRKLAIAAVHADAAGDDRTNLNDEYVVFENTGEQAIDLGGWTVTDETGASYTFPRGVTVEPGSQVTLHTGSGTGTLRDRYWGSNRPIWNNAGDTVTVRDAAGTVVVQETYG